MKNFYTFNLLLAALLAIAAFATYEPALKTSGSCGICAGFYEFQDAGDTAPPIAIADYATLSRVRTIILMRPDML